jgi:hypothetical protein
LNYVNPNGENVVANNLNHANFFFGNDVKIDFKNKHHLFFILRDVISARKIELLILVISLMEVE